jgi:O-antigen/teichoic acid export membrane protein
MGSRSPYDDRVSAASTTQDTRSAAHSTAIVAFALGLWSVGAYAFYLLAGRLLGPEDYGLAAALQAVIVAIALPAIALQWGAAKAIASSSAATRGDAFAVYRRAIFRFTVIAAALATLATIITVAVGMSRAGTPTGALVATYWATVPVVPLVLGMGALQGEHRYWGFAGAYGLTGILRAPLLVVLLAIPIIGSVEATSIATGIPYLLGALIALWLTREAFRGPRRPSAPAWGTFTHSVTGAFAGLAGIAILTNADVIAAKIGIGSDEAGYFGAAAIIAKALLMVPQALIVVLLPRVAEREKGGHATGPLLAAGVGVMVIAGVAAMALGTVLASAVVSITFGDEYAPATDLVVPFLGATTLLGALLILVNHHVGRSDRRFAWVVGVLAVLQVALLIPFSGSPQAIITVDAVVAGLGLIIHEIIYGRTDQSMVRGLGTQARRALHRTRSTKGTR